MRARGLGVPHETDSLLGNAPVQTAGYHLVPIQPAACNTQGEAPIAVDGFCPYSIVCAVICPATAVADSAVGLAARRMAGRLTARGPGSQHPSEWLQRFLRQ